jgi:hypothetical protein
MIFTAEKMFKGSLIGNGEVYLCKDNDDIVFHKKGEYCSVSFPIIKDTYGKTLFNVNDDYSYSSINPIFPTTFLKDENEKSSVFKINNRYLSKNKNLFKNRKRKKFEQ